MRFERCMLDNGLTLIGEVNPEALSAAAGYFVKTGSRDETASESGVSHFLEHMLFKGSSRRSAEDVNREFDEIGADYNAFTGEEYTVYYGAVLPEMVAPLVDILTDMMRPVLREEDFTMEKQVILEEIALYKDRPQFTVIDEARSTYYSPHPLGQSVLGTTESITALSRDQMFGYWERRYAPGNLVLALAGNFDWDAAVAQVNAQTAGWPAAHCDRPLSRHEPQAKRHVIRDEKVHRVHLALVAPGLPATSRDRYAAELIAEMVGGGDGSWLHWALVDPGLADVACLSHDEQDGDGAYFGYLSCSPENLNVVIEKTRSVLDRAMDGGFSEDEIRRAARKAASARVLHDETPRGRLFHLGFDWQYREEYLPVDLEIDRILGVTVDDTRRLLATRPFDALTLVTMGPVEPTGA